MISKDELRYADLAEEMAEDLRALGHPQRLRIIDELKLQGELTVSELVRRTRLPQSVVSLHLSKMKATRLVLSRREARQVVYWLSTEIAFVVADCFRRKYEAANAAAK
ncbi:MAG: ArsR/SmtB family transcription factor [Candidatus Spyradosoma sp.]